jgi:ribosome-binding protein aMBF1 (putative translation factor)
VVSADREGTVMGTRKWREIQAEMAAKEPGRAERMAERRQRMLAEYHTYEHRLPDLRRARALTQVELAEKLAVSQAQVRRIENSTDMYLSTLAQYVAALGGRLKVVVEIDGHELPVSLQALAEIEDPVAPETEELVPV